MDILNQRERGKTPLSIGTSLAFESLIGINDNIFHNPAFLQENQAIWVNVKTLFRNLYQSVSSKDIELVSAIDLAKELIEEIEFIKEFCRIDTWGLTPVFFCPNYRYLDKLNDEVLLRLDNTDNQKAYTARMTNSIGLVLQQYNSGLESNDQARIKVYENKITDPDPRKVLMFTHYAFDLTSFRQFNRLLLLESHTAAIKSRNEWYTKYYNGKELTNIPFRLDLLTILGDSTLFRNRTPALKREIIRIANEKKWSSITTAAKIKQDAREIKNHLIRDKLLSSISGI